MAACRRPAAAAASLSWAVCPPYCPSSSRPLRSTSPSLQQVTHFVFKLSDLVFSWNSSLIIDHIVVQVLQPRFQPSTWTRVISSAPPTLAWLLRRWRSSRASSRACHRYHGCFSLFAVCLFTTNGITEFETNNGVEGGRDEDAPVGGFLSDRVREKSEQDAVTDIQKHSSKVLHEQSSVCSRPHVQ